MEITDFPMRLCLATPSGAPGTWTLYEDWDWEKHPRAEFRTLCKNELLFDLDIDDKHTLYFTALLLSKRLKDSGIPFYVYDSGGKGYHFQIWLDAKSDVDWRQLRTFLTRKLAKDILHRTKIKKENHEFWRWNIDPRKISWDDKGMGSVVRAVGGKKKFCKVLLDEIVAPEDRKRHSRPIYQEDFQFELWKVPEEIVSKCFIREKAKKSEFVQNAEVPICIADLIELEESGIHLEHMQRVAIVAYIWREWKSNNPNQIMPKEDRDEIATIFMNDPEYNEGITEYQIGYTVGCLERYPYKIPRCKYMRREGIIDTELCQLCRMVKKNEN